MNKDERQALDSADRTRGDEELANEVLLGCHMGQYEDEYSEYPEYAAPADGGPFVTDIRPAYPQAAYPASSYPASSYPASSYPAPSSYSPFAPPAYPAYGVAPTTFSSTDPNQTLVNQIATATARGQRQWTRKLLRHIVKTSRRAIMRAYRQAGRQLPADRGRAEARWRVRYFITQNRITLPANVSLSGGAVTLEGLSAMSPNLRSKVQHLIAAGRIRLA
jgi:hypothetical protein